MFKKASTKTINILDISSIILSTLIKILLVFLFVAIYVEELKPFFGIGVLLFFVVYFPYILISFIRTKNVGKI